MAGITWLTPNSHDTATLDLRVNTRTSLWPTRWPAIAKATCIEAVEAAPPDQQAQVKYALPCSTCELATRCLNAKQKEQGTLLYGRELLTAPRSSESSMFPRQLFQPMLNDRMDMVAGYRKPAGLEAELAVVQAWDLAWSERAGGDWLVCSTAVVNLRTGQRRLLSVLRWQRLSFVEQCRLIEELWRKFAADMVVIESDAAQQIWSQYLAETSPVPVVRHSAGDKRSLRVGVPALLIQFENRKWEFPFRRDGVGHAEMENLLTEFEAFGWHGDRLEGVGEHDDAVMSFWHLAWGCGLLLARSGIEENRGVTDGRVP